MHRDSPPPHTHTSLRHCSKPDITATPFRHPLPQPHMWHRPLLNQLRMLHSWPLCTADPGTAVGEGAGGAGLK